MKSASSADIQAGMSRDWKRHEVDVGEWERWEFLRDAPQEDATDPGINRTARALLEATRIWAREGGTGRQIRCYAQLALALVQRELSYREDADQYGTNDDIRGYSRPYASPMQVVDRGGDDCDEKARLFVALMLAAGFAAKMVPWWTSSGEFAHVSAEFLSYTRKGEPEWLNAETILKRAQLGELADEVPRDAGGEWLR